MHKVYKWCMYNSKKDTSHIYLDIAQHEGFQVNVVSHKNKETSILYSEVFADYSEAEDVYDTKCKQVQRLMYEN